MPNKRHADQRFVACSLDRELGIAFEAERKRQGKSRSQFFREAIIEKLNSMGIKVDPQLALARDRGGDIFSANTLQAAKDVSGTMIQNVENFTTGARPEGIKPRHKGSRSKK